VKNRGTPCAVPSFQKEEKHAHQITLNGHGRRRSQALNISSTFMGFENFLIKFLVYSSRNTNLVVGR